MVDSTRQYLLEIGRYPALTPEDELALGRQVRRWVEAEKVKTALTDELGRTPTRGEWATAVGCADPTELETMLGAGKRAREKMIRCNLKLVVYFAKRLQKQMSMPSALDMMDLIQEGNIGLDRAVKKFDPDKGYRFSTYAYWWVKQAIQRAIQNGDTIRISLSMQDKRHKLNRVEQDFQNTHQRRPSLEELAAALNSRYRFGTSPLTLAHVAELKAFKLSCMSYDAIATEDGTTFEDVLPTPDPVDPYEEIERELALEQLDAAMEGLELYPDERTALLRARHVEGRTWEQLALDFGKSELQLRRVEEKGLKRLQKEMDKCLKKPSRKASPRKKNQITPGQCLLEIS